MLWSWCVYGMNYLHNQWSMAVVSITSNFALCVLRIDIKATDRRKKKRKCPVIYVYQLDFAYTRTHISLWPILIINKIFHSSVTFFLSCRPYRSNKPTYKTKIFTDWVTTQAFFEQFFDCQIFFRLTQTYNTRVCNWAPSKKIRHKNYKTSLLQQTKSSSSSTVKWWWWWMNEKHDAIFPSKPMTFLSVCFAFEIRENIMAS